MARTRALPPLLGIAALSAVLLAGIKSDRLPERKLSRLQRAARLLRAGMTMSDVLAATNGCDDMRFAVGGTSHFHVASFFDPRRREFLRLHFETGHSPLTGRYEMLLLDWNVSGP